MSSGSTSCANRTASSADQPRLASTARMKSRPPASHARGELVVNQADDLAAVLAVVAVVDFAHEPLVGAHAGDDGAALEHGVRAASEVPAERNLDRDGLDAVNAHGGRSRARSD